MATLLWAQPKSRVACAKMTKTHTTARLPGLLGSRAYSVPLCQRKRGDDPIGNKRRARNHNFMLVQQPQHLMPPYDTLDKLLERLDEIGAERYAGILHDKDPGEIAHLHIFMHFQYVREIDPLAKALNIAPQYLERWDEGMDNGFAYLTHRTPKAASSYQYSPNEVTANFNYIDWLSRYEAKKRKDGKNPSHGDDVKYLLDCLYVGIVTREDVEKQLSGSQYAQYHKRIDDVWAKYLQNLAEERMRIRKAAGETVEVIWIYGDAGTGKTRFAKEQAKKRDKNYYITGSSRDPFQRYNGEDFIIYDEARPNDISFSDLLKLLDPYGEDVSAPSRYYDKAICAAAYYITTPYSPIDFYRKIMGESWKTQSDGFGQLLRRLSLVLEMTADCIQAMEYDPLACRFTPIPGAVRENPYHKMMGLTEESKVEKFKALFGTAALTLPDEL